VDGHGRSAWSLLPVDSDDRSEALDQYSMAMAVVAFSFAPAGLLNKAITARALNASTVGSAPAAVVGPEGTVPGRPPGEG
jgi:hypothetical protein